MINPCSKLSHLEYKLSLSHYLSLAEFLGGRRRPRALKILEKNLQNTSSILYSLLPIFAGPDGLFIGCREEGSRIKTGGTNLRLNGQRTAAEMRPEPRFRGRILAVVPAISVASLLGFVGHVDLLEC